MAYQVVNEELQIYSCSIADLTLKQTSDFLSQWENSASIGQLTMFYESSTGRLVLNCDNKNYEKFLDIAIKFLSASEQNMEKALKESCGERIEEELNVLNGCVKDRTFKQELKKIRNNTISGKYSDTLERLYREDPCCLGHSLAFIYGMMCGKREERAKKKNREIKELQLEPELTRIVEICRGLSSESLEFLKKIAIRL